MKIHREESIRYTIRGHLGARKLVRSLSKIRRPVSKYKYVVVKNRSGAIGARKRCFSVKLGIGTRCSSDSSRIGGFVSLDRSRETVSSRIFRYFPLFFFHFRRARSFFFFSLSVESRINGSRRISNGRRDARTTGSEFSAPSPPPASSLEAQRG